MNKFVIYASISAILVAALYSSSAFMAFGDMKCISTARNPADQICTTTNENGKVTDVLYCYPDNKGNTICIDVYSGGPGSDIPGDLRDALDVGVRDSQNATKVPKGDNFLQDDGNLGNNGPSDDNDNDKDGLEVNPE